MKRGLFVTGTDTNVGKTFVSALLLSAIEQSGMKAGYFKPIQTGPDDDTHEALRLSGLPLDQAVSPAYRLAAPTAPFRAAAIENTVIETDRICRRWQELGPASWIIEGAGGLLVPIAIRTTIRELIGDLGVPVVLVASTRLGTINHTLLSLEAAHSHGLRVAGVILVGEPDPGLADTIRGFTSVPLLTEVPRLDRVDSTSVRELAPRIFSAATLEMLFSDIPQFPGFPR